MTEKTDQSEAAKAKKIATFRLDVPKCTIVSGSLMKKDSKDEVELRLADDIKLQKTTLQKIARQINYGKHNKHVVFRSIGSENECRGYIKPQNGKQILDCLTTDMADVMTISMIK